MLRLQGKNGGPVSGYRSRQSQGAAPYASTRGDSTHDHDVGAVPHDGGVTALASGEAILNGEGIPVAYHVASGDVFSTIAARFCLSEDWLLLINHAHRASDALYAGDTLNLDPHTIFSVGDQNGVVSHTSSPRGTRFRRRGDRAAPTG
jgi:hypothetical protein